MSGDAVPFGAAYRDNAEYMLGSVTVTAVLHESDGRIDPQRKDWSRSEVEQIKQQIGQGLKWWQDTLK